jgi:hypothetical protein
MPRQLRRRQAEIVERRRHAVAGVIAQQDEPGVGIAFDTGEGERAAVLGGRFRGIEMQVHEHLQ